jgi:hypothetical protein
MMDFDSWDDDIPNAKSLKSCSKPPSSSWLVHNPDKCQYMYIHVRMGIVMFESFTIDTIVNEYELGWGLWSLTIPTHNWTLIDNYNYRMSIHGTLIILRLLLLCLSNILSTTNHNCYPEQCISG